MEKERYIQIKASCISKLSLYYNASINNNVKILLTKFLEVLAVPGK